MSQEWIQLHLPQLMHYKVPPALHERVYSCIHNEAEDAALALDDLVDVTSKAKESPSSVSSSMGLRRRLRVVARESMPAESLVRRIDHEWSFSTVVDAQAQLRAGPALLDSMHSLVADVIDPTPDQQTEGSDSEEDFVIRHLHLLAFSIRFGHKSTDMLYYVLNRTGSSLHEANEPNVQVAPIFCQQQQKLFSIMWPVKDIAAGQELVRAHATKISMMALCKKSYWEARYEGEDEYDWYCEYPHVAKILATYLTKSQRVLVSGSGTSRLPIDMFLDGYSDVVAMDYAANVVHKMKTRCEANSWGVSFVEADMTSMSDWVNESVDSIVDKGCIDTMLVKPETDAVETNWKSVAPDSADDLEDAKKSMLEAARILKPDGYLILMTFGNPSNRIGLFDWVCKGMEWDVQQCLEMSPDSGLRGFSARFFLFVAQKKAIQTS